MGDNDATVDHAALHAAVCRDDVAAVEAIFQDEAVRDQVREMDAKVLEGFTLGTNVFAVKEFRPFFLFCPRGVYQRSRLLSGEAARLNCLQVLAWFFAPEQSELMGASLRYAIARVAKRAATVDALEILLTSTVFLDRISDSRRQKVLDRSLQGARNRDVISLLLAHGAQLTPPVAHACAVKAFKHGRLEQLNAVVELGGSLVGAELLRTTISSRHYGSTFMRRLLELGVAGGTAIGDALIAAAARTDFESVALLIKEGFADVDAQTDDGSTALVRTGRAWPRASEVDQIVRMLLEYGASLPKDTTSVSPYVKAAISALEAETQHKSDCADDQSSGSKGTESSGNDPP